MVNWGTVTPVVVAIIGISGVVLPVFSTVFINQIYIKPTAYDQGGRKTSVEKPSTPVDTAFFGFLYLYILVAESIVFIYIGHIHKGRKRRRFLQQITKQMMDVSKSLRRDPLALATLPNPLELRRAIPRDAFRRRLVPPDGIMPPNAIWQVGVYYNAFLNYRRRIDSRNLITEINDYIRVDGLYSKLVERNSYIRNNSVINNFTLAELNRQCLELAEDALTKVNWIKYR
jgi:hypothetical protein